MAWNFQRVEPEFKPIAEGKYRVMIVSAEKAVSKTSGNDMLVIKLLVSGTNSHLWYYIPFLDNKPEVTNRMLTSFFDSFAGIEPGDFNLQSWLGKTGAVKTKIDENDRAKVAYFISKDKQSDLPAWQGERPTFNFDVIQDSDDELPF